MQGCLLSQIKFFKEVLFLYFQLMGNIPKTEAQINYLLECFRVSRHWFIIYDIIGKPLTYYY